MVYVSISSPEALTIYKSNESNKNEEGGGGQEEVKEALSSRGETGQNFKNEMYIFKLPTKKMMLGCW